MQKWLTVVTDSDWRRLVTGVGTVRHKSFRSKCPEQIVERQGVLFAAGVNVNLVPQSIHLVDQSAGELEWVDVGFDLVKINPCQRLLLCCLYRLCQGLSLP